MALPVGTMLENRYRIERSLARGGMGAIYQAFDTNLDIPVAIKENFFSTPQSVSQFQREAQILARLHHPNLPRVIQHFSHQGQQYLVMDFIAGQDLWELVQQRGKPLDERLALDYMIQVCDAVDYLHRQHPPIIHRDIKPQNIKITPLGQAVLVDFGIAKVAEDNAQTQTGAQGVTPGFSPPEQYSGEGTLPASDVYSLGATLYAVLTGKKPPHSVSLLVDRTKFKPPLELNRNLSRQVSTAIMHAMQVRVADRPLNAGVFKKELQVVLNSSPVPGEEATMSGEKAPQTWLTASNGQRFQLKMGSYWLGRAAQCEFQLNDRRASRRHATIRFDGSNCTVFDEGSANGTFINDQPVGSRGVPLHPGDRLRIGDTTLQISGGDVAPAAPVFRPQPLVDDLSSTEFEPDLSPLSRPASAPVAPPLASQVPVYPASGSPPAKSGGSGWVWLILGFVVILLLLGVIGTLLYLQSTVPPAPVVNTQATLLAQAVATEEANATATQAAAPTDTPAPTASPTDTPPPTPTATRVQSQSDALGGADRATPTVAVSDTPTASPTATTSPTGTASPTPSATFSPTPPPAPLPAGVFEGFESDSVWKRGDEPNGELNRSSAQVYEGAFSGQLDYNFATSGNDYVVFLRNVALAGSPKTISVWVYGDGAGHFLNVWLKDAGGETWQMSFGQITHIGWQQMVATLDPAAPWPGGHISGPGNGAIDYPISFQGLVLDDGSDTFTGRGTIYLDNLGTAVSSAGAVTPVKPDNPTPVTPPVSRQYVLKVGNQHLYEPWGAPNGNDICEAYRNRDFNDKIRMKGFNLELSLTNNSNLPVPDDWEPTFVTDQGKTVQVCYYGYAGSGPKPGATAFMTFFTIVSPDDFVRTVLLEINGELLQICLDPSGAQTPC